MKVCTLIPDVLKMCTSCCGEINILNSCSNINFFYRRALRATLILVPLLGVQYLFVPVSLPRTHPAYMFFTVLSAYLSAYQVGYNLNSYIQEQLNFVSFQNFEHVSAIILGCSG